MEITARLTNVRIEALPDSASLDGFCHVAHGDIYNDTRQRFSDGSPVRTSRIVKFENGFLHTQNSIYKVI
jgi:hypothetical protein